MFYSLRYPEYQVSAEFEYDESKDEGEFSQPANASSMKSIFFKVTEKKSGKVLTSYNEKDHGESDLIQLLTAVPPCRNCIFEVLDFRHIYGRSFSGRY